MKFGQLIKYNEKNIFGQKSCRKKGRETSSEHLFLFSRKALYEAKAGVLRLMTIYFDSFQLGIL